MATERGDGAPRLGGLSAARTKSSTGLDHVATETDAVAARNTEIRVAADQGALLLCLSVAGLLARV